MQILLGANEALVLFLVRANESYVFVLMRERFDWRTISLGEKDMAAKVAAFRRGLDVDELTKSVDARKREPRVRVQIGHRDPPSFSRVMTRPERSGKASNEQSFFLHSPEARGALSKQLNYLIA